MKSIMEAAKSLVKAIENGWKRAGKPSEFTVKVLQEPKKNLFGFTTKSAKVALLFNEKKEAAPHARRERQPKQQQQRQTKKAVPEKNRQPQKTGLKKIWTDERVEFAKQWITALLTIMKRNDVSFQTSIDRSAIRFTFNKPLASNSEKEKQIFRSWAHLLAQTVKHTYRHQFKSIKVILKSSH